MIDGELILIARRDEGRPLNDVKSKVSQERWSDEIKSRLTGYKLRKNVVIQAVQSGGISWKSNKFQDLS